MDDRESFKTIMTKVGTRDRPIQSWCRLFKCPSFCLFHAPYGIFSRNDLKNEESFHDLELRKACGFVIYDNLLSRYPGDARGQSKLRYVVVYLTSCSYPFGR